MSKPASLSDAELVARLPLLVRAERSATFEVIEHLVEMERRRLYLAHATSSLYRYCIDRLGYAEDAALKRHRVARLALRLPQVLEEVRAGTMHLTGLFLLSTYLTEDNADALLGEARGKSRRQIEKIIARWFPRPDVASRIEPAPVAAMTAREPAVHGRFLGAEPLPSAEQPALPGTEHQPDLAGARRIPCSGAGVPDARSRLEPLSPSRWRVEFTAGAELYDKLERARELLSHAVPSGDLGALFERALDALLEKETRKRFGAGQPRKARALTAGSRRVPVEVVRAVWERDGAQCTFVDEEGHRCGERRFLTLEHRQPFAMGGPSDADNLCLLCSAHNLASARNVFGPRHIDEKILSRTQLAIETRASPGAFEGEQPIGTDSAPLPRDAAAAVLLALCNMGFRRREAAEAVGRACACEPNLDLRALLKKSMWLLVPATS